MFFFAVDMSKTLEEKETEASELKIELKDTRRFMVEQASLLHNYNKELHTSRKCVDTLKEQNEKVHKKNKELLEANTHMLQTYMPLQRVCNTLLIQIKEKEKKILTRMTVSEDRKWRMQT